ncbi:hypothetical protein E1292_07900 [Nonomuraea deserti]|uniref:Uncharacterized protein n=1 Tax=Nonomuraea deserti TaxID=1848322 RepID=A0A4R4VWE6_9ACTN|nr:hypothetical protein [Nonomuraea deserti]TDD10419.1 hypothetical protein E1292_07900 [Nonomuraea deserti]
MFQDAYSSLDPHMRVETPAPALDALDALSVAGGTDGAVAAVQSADRRRAEWKRVARWMTAVSRRRYPGAAG